MTALARASAHPDFGLIRMTESKYLDAEAASPVKHEYFNGIVEAMAGANERHEIVALNLATLIHAHLRGKRCRVFKSDMKLRVTTDDKVVHFYPDIMVTCDRKDTHPIYKEKPTLIIEVASDDWERDYYMKLAAYLPIPSLLEYVVVWPDKKKASVTIFRPTTGLKPAAVHKKGSFTLESIGLTIALNEVYRE